MQVSSVSNSVQNQIGNVHNGIQPHGFYQILVRTPCDGRNSDLTIDDCSQVLHILDIFVRRLPVTKFVQYLLSEARHNGWVHAEEVDHKGQRCRGGVSSGYRELRKWNVSEARGDVPSKMFRLDGESVSRTEECKS